MDKWIDPTKLKAKAGQDSQDEEELEEIEEEENEEKQKGKSLKEIPPNLFTPLSEDKSIDPVQPTPYGPLGPSLVSLPNSMLLTSGPICGLGLPRPQS